MTSKNLTPYQRTAFCEETPTDDFYIYMSVNDIALKANSNRCDIWKCRTVGILRSINGHFFLNDIASDSDQHSPKLLISMIYLKPPVPCNVIPNTVQVFGTIHWIDRPVLFAKILQVLNPNMALNLQMVLNSIVNNHLALPEKR